MFQAQNRETVNSSLLEKLLCPSLQDHYDIERDKTVFHNTTSPDLHDQDQDEDRFFW